MKFEKNYGKDTQKSLPKGLAEVKWGGAEGLAKAIKHGEVIETSDANGVTFCKWQQFEVGKVSGKQESQSISGNKGMNKAQHTCFVCVPSGEFVSNHSLRERICSICFDLCVQSLFNVLPRLSMTPCLSC